MALLLFLSLDRAQSGALCNAIAEGKSVARALLLALGRAFTQQWLEMGDSDLKRTYLVVVDDSAESRVALRFAARRAAKTDGRIEVLGIVEPQDFVQFGGVQAAIEEEQRLRIEGVVSSAIGEILDKSGIDAQIIIRQGEAVRGGARVHRRARRGCALVLGAAPSGSPGVLVADFTGADAGQAALPGDDHPRLAER